MGWLPGISRRISWSAKRRRIALSRVIRDYLSSSGQFKFEAAEHRPDRRACLRITIAQTTRANEALARRTPHDFDGDRRHAALHCSRVGHWNFLWFYTAVSAEDFAIHSSCVDLPLQQDRSCDCGDVARCNDLGDACAISCGVSVRVLDTQSTGSSARAFSPVSTA